MAHGKFWKRLGDFFTNLFGNGNGGADIVTAAEGEWEHLEPELKDALINGSSIINEIASGKDSLVIVDSLKTLFPNADEITKVQQGLQQLASDITGIETSTTDSLDVTIRNLQAYFEQHSGTKLERVLSQAAQTLASIFSPNSKFALVVQFIEVAYRVFVKK